MLHILLDLGVLLAGRRPRTSDEARRHVQPGSSTFVAASLRRYLHQGEHHARNVIDFCRGRLRGGGIRRRSGRRRDG
jgi:hypothetical protein